VKQVIPFLCLCVFGVGCSALNVQPPTASVTGMNVQGVDANGFTMNFTVGVTNPNAGSLPLTAADYSLGLAGVNVLDGTAKPEGAIPAHGTQSVTLPVTLSYERLLAAEQGIVKSGGNVPYALDGGLSFNSGVPLLGDVHVALPQFSGTLPLRDVLSNPQAILQDPAAQKLAKELLGHMLSR
jgi:LEA14-like dessication related protein